jgi:hypothetical protein
MLYYSINIIVELNYNNLFMYNIYKMKVDTNMYIIVIYLYIIYITYLDSRNKMTSIPILFFNVFDKGLAKLIILTSIVYITANVNADIGLLLAFSYILTINLLDKRMIEESFFSEVNQYISDTLGGTENYTSDETEDITVI